MYLKNKTEKMTIRFSKDQKNFIKFMAKVLQTSEADAVRKLIDGSMGNYGNNKTASNNG